MEIFSDKTINTSLLEALRGAAAPAVHPDGETHSAQSGPQTAAPVSKPVSSEEPAPEATDTAQALLALNVWGKHGSAAKTLFAPPAPTLNDTDPLALTRQLADYVLQPLR